MLLQKEAGAGGRRQVLFGLIRIFLQSGWLRRRAAVLFLIIKDVFEIAAGGGGERRFCF
jgi:hypothetical protein